MSDEQMMTRAETAAHLKVSIATLKRFEKTGRLTPYGGGATSGGGARMVRYKRADVLACLTVKAPPAADTGAAS